MSGAEDVRSRFASAEDVDLPEGLEPPSGQAGPPEEPPPGAPDPESGPPPEAEAAQFPLNDTGNGRRFVCYWGEDYLHVPRVGWFGWDGRRWRKDPDELEVRRQAQQLSERMLLEVPHLRMPKADAEAVAQEPGAKADKERLRSVPADDRTAEDNAGEEKANGILSRAGKARARFYKRQDRHRSHANTTGNSARIDSLMKEAAVHRSHALDALDAAPLDVNCESGTLRFRVVRAEGSTTAEVELAGHARDDRLTKLVPAEYAPDAACPKFEAFLHRIQPDEAMRSFLQRWFGLCMTALTNEQKLVFLYGSGANGKSVLVELMARMLGDYAATAKIESLTGRNRRGGADATPDLIPLIGARMVRASEPEEGERLQEGKIKELTGGEPILVRALHSDFVEVVPRFKLTISGNHKPEIRGDDDGIWRRVLLVPFDVQIPKAERVPLPEMLEDLMQERDGILNWLVAGLLDYLEGGLAEPEAVLDATREYREDSDPIGQFLTAACAITGNPDDSLTSKELVEGFNFWLAENGAGQWKPGTVQRRLKGKADVWRDPRTGTGFTERKSSGIMRYDGIRLQDAFARRLNDAARDHQGRPVAGGSKSADDQEPTF